MTASNAQLKEQEVANDLDLVHASKKGDVVAFEQLVKRYNRKLFRIAQTVTHNTEDAEDAVQEALFKAFRNLDQFREESKFSTWVIRITVNQSLMKLRKWRTTKELSLNEICHADGDLLRKEVVDWAPNPEQHYWTSELRGILLKALNEMRPVLRAVFVIRDIKGFSIDQTAEVLNLSETAVKARLWRARLHLGEFLNNYFKKQKGTKRSELVLSDQ
jgi:RNA polymerase sigma-70 factor, ECF subfamily